MGLPSGASAKPTPMVDASGRKFYIKAAENGNEGTLKKFDAALSAQSNRPPAPPVVAQPESVTPQRAEDPSNQEFYNMAADRENKVIDQEVLLNSADWYPRSVQSADVDGKLAVRQYLQVHGFDRDVSLSILNEQPAFVILRKLLD